MNVEGLIIMKPPKRSINALTILNLIIKINSNYSKNNFSSSKLLSLNLMNKISCELNICYFEILCC